MILRSLIYSLASTLMCTSQVSLSNPSCSVVEARYAAKGAEEVDWALSVEALWAVIECGLLRLYV